MKKSTFALSFIVYSLSLTPAFSQRWDTVGPKINIYIVNEGPDVLYADSNYMYMAGIFQSIGNKYYKGIARWNGTQWDSLGRGIDGLDTLNPNYPADNTWAITRYNGKLYVGGSFSSLGNVKALFIGTWDGSAWDSMPVQPFNHNGGVTALQVINNKLYMGGGFDSIAGFPCIGIACWNDTNWSSLSFPNLGGFYIIDAICEYKGSIYVGGNFYGNNLNDRSCILRYDSTGNWDSVGRGVRGSLAEIQTMAVYQGELYVGGFFFKSDGNAGNCIQRWDGTAWHDVGGGSDYGQIVQLLVYKNKLYAVGAFYTMGGVQAPSIAEWDGTEWCSLGSTFDNRIDAACIYKDSLYIGGGFGTINGDTIIHIAEWTGGNYTDSCGVITTGINELRTKNEEVRVDPNPNSGVFQLGIRNKQLGRNSRVEIYNMLGQQIYSKTFLIPDSQFQINLCGQPSGIYLYRVLSATGELLGDGKFVIN